jgi:hypothetical protein
MAEDYQLTFNVEIPWDKFDGKLFEKFIDNTPENKKSFLPQFADKYFIQTHNTSIVLIFFFEFSPYHIYFVILY